MAKTPYFWGSGNAGASLNPVRNSQPAPFSTPSPSPASPGYSWTPPNIEIGNRQVTDPLAFPAHVTYPGLTETMTQLGQQQVSPNTLYKQGATTILGSAAAEREKFINDATRSRLGAGNIADWIRGQGAQTGALLGQARTGAVTSAAQTNSGILSSILQSMLAQAGLDVRQREGDIDLLSGIRNYFAGLYGSSGV